jgi:hypothetical protein
MNGIEKREKGCEILQTIKNILINYTGTTARGRND